MKAYAVIETGGKQYWVRPGDVVRVERLAEAEKAQVQLTPVLAVRSEDGPARIGTPVVEGASVTATVTRHLRGEKVVAFKKKRRKGYHKKIGHRQQLTELKIEAIHAP